MLDGDRPLSSPVHIDSVVIPDGSGRIGMMACPGSRPRPGFRDRHDHRLNRDLEMIGAWGAAGIISLVEQAELAELGVVDLAQRVQRFGLWWLHLPIRDKCAPDKTFELQWQQQAPGLLRHLHLGGRVAIHCWAGLGRTGTISARLLIEMGADADDAIRQVREARPGTIETRQQEIYLRSLAARLGR